MYPEEWDEQVAEQEQAYWMSLKESIGTPDAEEFSSEAYEELPLWKKILLKNESDDSPTESDKITNIGENNEDND